LARYCCDGVIPWISYIRIAILRVKSNSIRIFTNRYRSTKYRVIFTRYYRDGVIIIISSGRCRSLVRDDEVWLFCCCASPIWFWLRNGIRTAVAAIRIRRKIIFPEKWLDTNSHGKSITTRYKKRSVLLDPIQYKSVREYCRRSYTSTSYDTPARISTMAVVVEVHILRD
jgi:hypothetical protein